MEMNLNLICGPRYSAWYPEDDASYGNDTVVLDTVLIQRFDASTPKEAEILKKYEKLQGKIGIPFPRDRFRRDNIIVMIFDDTGSSLSEAAASLPGAASSLPGAGLTSFQVLLNLVHDCLRILRNAHGLGIFHGNIQPEGIHLSELGATLEYGSSEGGSAQADIIQLGRLLSFALPTVRPKLQPSDLNACYALMCSWSDLIEHMQEDGHVDYDGLGKLIAQYRVKRDHFPLITYHASLSDNQVAELLALNIPRFKQPGKTYEQYREALTHCFLFGNRLCELLAMSGDQRAADLIVQEVDEFIKNMCKEDAISSDEERRCLLGFAFQALEWATQNSKTRGLWLQLRRMICHAAGGLDHKFEEMWSRLCLDDTQTNVHQPTAATTASAPPPTSTPPPTISNQGGQSNNGFSTL